MVMDVADAEAEALALVVPLIPRGGSQGVNRWVGGQTVESAAPLAPPKPRFGCRPEAAAWTRLFSFLASGKQQISLGVAQCQCPLRPIAGESWVRLNAGQCRLGPGIAGSRSFRVPQRLEHRRPRPHVHRANALLRRHRAPRGASLHQLTHHGSRWYFYRVGRYRWPNCTRAGPCGVTVARSRP
jgi:hypothetical protein